MKLIKLKYPLDEKKVLEEPVVLAMGFFDGVHLGHQAVLSKAKKIAQVRGIKMAVLTYDHHPQIVFGNIPTHFKYLSAPERKLELLADYGVDIVYQVSFTSKLGALSPQQFVDTYLIGLHANVVVAGFDHTYGPKDIATMAHLPKYANKRFEVVEVASMQLLAKKIGSTEIRECLASGDLDQANAMLGYVYQTTGLVVHGKAIGRTIGYPTANILTPVDERIPTVGVYAVEIKIGDQWYQGMASIGYNETIGEGRPKTLEINILDYHEEIYGENVKVKWLKYLRPMVKYAGLPALIEQLAQDEQDVRNFFKRS